MRSRPSPQPQPLRLWNTFQPETHRQLVALWSDLLQRQLQPPASRRTSQESPAMNALSPKVEARHLRLRAIVYVRQSTPRQVVANPESTRRQYGLAEQARQMGWPAAQIEVIDEDLGLSGASSMAGRASSASLPRSASARLVSCWSPRSRACPGATATGTV